MVPKSYRTPLYGLGKACQRPVRGPPKPRAGLAPPGRPPPRIALDRPAGDDAAPGGPLPRPAVSIRSERDEDHDRVLHPVRLRAQGGRSGRRAPGALPRGGGHLDPGLRRHLRRRRRRPTGLLEGEDGSFPGRARGAGAHRLSLRGEPRPARWACSLGTGGPRVADSGLRSRWGGGRGGREFPSRRISGPGGQGNQQQGQDSDDYRDDRVRLIAGGRRRRVRLHGQVGDTVSSRFARRVNKYHEMRACGNGTRDLEWEWNSGQG